MVSPGIDSAPRDPYAEARLVTGGRYDPRVLEPWGPEAGDDPFLAPDPAAPGVRGALPVVSPVGTGDLTWDELCTGDADLARWCAARWLAGPGALVPPPADLARTRDAVHLVAMHVLAPWRHAAHRRIGLRWVLGGLGTPWAHGDQQLRVVDGLLIHQDSSGARTVHPATLGEAAALGGGPLGYPLAGGDGVAPTPPDPATPLALDPVAAAWLGEWWGLGTRALEEVRVGEADYPRRRVQLWPEHLDVAVDLGDGGHRGTFGASPGDEDHDGPYLYVTAREPERLHGDVRADPAFPGVSMPASELLAAPSPLDAAVAFFAHYRGVLGPAPA